MVNGDKQKIFEFVSKNGPVLPVHISKQIGSNILLAGALMSELVSNKKIFLTTVKRGGSPFYYVKGQEQRLQNLAECLSGREKEIYNLIKEKKVIRDKTAEPWQRVALRAIKDFAYPLQVKLGGNTEIFWKWYIMGNDDVKPYLMNLMKVKSEKPKEKIKPIEDVKIESEEILKEEKIEKPKEVKKTDTGKFLEELREYLGSKSIHLVASEIIRKGREINLIVGVPSNTGVLKYYVKAKNKKTINDADLSLALSEGQQRKLPVLFLTKGKLTKKAEKHLETNIGGQVIFRQIR